MSQLTLADFLNLVSDVNYLVGDKSYRASAFPVHQDRHHCATDCRAACERSRNQACALGGMISPA